MGRLVKRSGLLLFAGAALAWGAATAARGRCEALRPSVADQGLTAPPIPAEVARPFTFGMRSAAADATFIEAIQIFGARRGQTPAEALRDDAATAQLLNYTTDLDERFADGYWLAGTALPRHTIDNKAYGVLAAESILAKAVRLKVPDWRLPFMLGFIQSYYLGHMAEASANVALAASLPSAPKYLGLLATRLAADAGEMRTAEVMAETMAQSAADDDARADWARRLQEIKLERQLRRIETAARSFKERTGAWPQSLDTLVRAGGLAALPPPPDGGAYRLDPKTGEASSTGSKRLRVRGRYQTQAGMEVH